jgi:hypothetical protein
MSENHRSHSGLPSAVLKCSHLHGKMKKVVVLVLLVVSGVVWLLFSARIKVDLAAMKYDPATLKLRLTYPSLIHAVSITGRMQTGLVSLPDGAKVKFWFVSHHIAGPGCARFDFSDGTRKYVYGDGFCCEVQIGDEGISNERDLTAFLERCDEGLFK